MQRTNFYGKSTILIFMFFITFSSILAHNEVGFRVLDSDGNFKSNVQFDVYYYDQNLQTYTTLYTSGTTLGNAIQNYHGNYINGGFDIYPQDGEAVRTLGIVINNQIIRMDFGGGNRGDALIFIQDQHPWNITPYNSGYNFDGPHEYHMYPITLTNNMGGDNAEGVIHFNSLDITVGNTPNQSSSLTREGTTFLYGGHVVMGDNNQPGSYVRKWRNFSGDVSTSSISTVLTSARDYNIAGNYARQLNFICQNNFPSGDNGGVIYVRGISKNSPFSTTFCEDTTYTLQAVNQVILPPNCRQEEKQLYLRKI